MDIQISKAWEIRVGQSSQYEPIRATTSQQLRSASTMSGLNSIGQGLVSGDSGLPVFQEVAFLHSKKQNSKQKGWED